MHRALLASVVILAGCGSSLAKSSAPPPPAPAVPAASASSFDIGNGVALRVRKEPDGGCTTAAISNDNELWSERACLGTKDHPWFLSPDKEWLLVLERSPSLTESDLSSIRVGRLFRRGVPDRSLTLGDLSIEPTAVQLQNGRLQWLGEDPRPVADGVELRLADWTVARFRWTPAAAQQPVRAAVQRRTCEPCAYVDQQGVYHLAATEDEIPAQYRGQARAVQGQVIVYTAPPAARGRAAEPSGPQPWEILHEQTMQKKAAAAEVEDRARRAREYAERQQQDQRNWVQRLADSQGSPGGGARCYDNSMRPRPCDDGERRQGAESDINARIRATNPGYTGTPGTVW